MVPGGLFIPLDDEAPNRTSLRPSDLGATGTWKIADGPGVTAGDGELRLVYADGI